MIHQLFLANPISIQVPKLIAFNERKLKKSQGNRNFSYKTSSSNLSAADEEGIMILSSPKDQIELENKVKKQAEELEEMRNLLQKERSASKISVPDEEEGGETRRKSVTFQDEDEISSGLTQVLDTEVKNDEPISTKTSADES